MSIDISKVKIVETKLIDNFLSADEISVIDQLVRSREYLEKYTEYQDYVAKDHLLPEGEIFTKIQTMFINEARNDEFFKSVYDIIRPKLDLHFGKELIINDIHCLDAYHPYNIHSDGMIADIDYDKAYGAYTIVIPFDDYDSNTIIFNEYDILSERKYVSDWIENTKAQKKHAISDELYEKYLTNCPKFLVEFLSLETIFPWKKGNCLAASRYKFHTSDNFLKNGIKHKRGLILWTTYPKD